MDNQTGALHSMGYVAETVIGETPTTPAFKSLPVTGTTLKLTKETIESELLTGDRNRSCVKHGNRAVNGDASSELLYDDHKDFMEALLGGTFEADTPSVGTEQVKNGSTRRGFTLYRKYGDLGYNIYTGVEVNTLALEVANQSFVTANFGLIGVDQNPAHTEPAGATFAPQIGKCPFSSFVGSIQRNGSPVSIVTSLSLSVDNQIQPSYRVFENTTGEKSIGKILVSGSLTLQLVDFAYHDLFESETKEDLEFTLTDDEGNSVKFILPNCLFNSANDDVSGDGEIPLTVEFTAEYDATSDASIVVEYTAA